MDTTNGRCGRPGSTSGAKVTPHEAIEKVWEFIRGLALNLHYPLNDILDADYDSLIKLVSDKPKQKKKVHTLFEFIESGGG